MGTNIIMETFEIHITGSDSRILKELSDMGIKGIHIALLKRDGSTLREEFMSSTRQMFINFDECVKWTNGLTSMLEAKGIKIIRKKIECPPSYHHYVNLALYMEAHWEYTKPIDISPYPISKNVISDKLLATHRVYDKSLFRTLQKISDQNLEVEYCLMDTYINEDFDWFQEFKIEL